MAVVRTSTPEAPASVSASPDGADRTVGGSIWTDAGNGMSSVSIDRTAAAVTALSGAEGIALFDLGRTVAEEPTVLIDLIPSTAADAAANLLLIAGVAIASSAAAYNAATSPSAWGSTVWGPGVSAGTSGAGGLHTNNGPPSVGSTLANVESLQLSVAIRGGRMAITGALFAGASTLALTPPAVVSRLTGSDRVLLMLAAGHSLIGLGAETMGFGLYHHIALPGSA